VDFLCHFVHKLHPRQLRHTKTDNNSVKLDPADGVA